MNLPTASPKVSVCVITYNHEHYINECLQSIIEQDTNFGFEIIVGDDCSTDGTREIISGFSEKFPNIVKPIFYKKKVGGTQNYLQVHHAAKGKYIAHIDGDDFALPGKLQAQVDCLDSNPDIAMSAHAVNYIINDKISNSIFGNDSSLPVKGDISDLLRLGTYFSNSSIMYRSENRIEHRDDSDYVDYFFHIEQVSRGWIHLDKRVFGCYRIHDKGITKDFKQRTMVENCYEEAFNRAIELNASIEQIQSARMRRRMVFAIERYRSGDIPGYLDKIIIDKDDLKYATNKHKFLHYSRRHPFLIDIYFMLRRLV